MSRQKILFVLLILAAAGFSAFVSSCQTTDIRVPKASAEQIEPQPTPVNNREPITIAAVGDMMIGSPFPNETRMPPNDGADIFKEVTPILTRADITFGNLEGPIADGGVSEKCGTGRANCFAFRMPTRYGRYFKEAGFDVLSVANNHAGDFGDAGRASTRKVLDEQGIKYAGSDRAQFASTILNVKGRRVAFVGFAHNNISLNVNDLDAARRVVSDLTKRADIIVVSFHGGAEGTDSQNVPQRTELFFGEARGNLPLFARTVIDAGADLVLGHGPHVLRGMEIYKDRLIAYSLGNFATYGWFKLEAETAMTIILEASLDADGKFLGGKINSGLLLGRGIPTPDKEGQALRKVRSLSQTDFGINAPKIADDGTISVK